MVAGVLTVHKKKDAHIPNSFPMKEEVLREAEQRKNRVGVSCKIHFTK